MIAPRPWHLMLGAGIGLAVLNYAIASHPPSAEPILLTSSFASDAGRIDRVEPFALPPGVQFTHALERPVFSDTRRPWLEPAVAPIPEPPPAEPVPEANPPPPAPQISVSLFGIQQNSGFSQALLLKSGETEPRWVRSGETLDGWTLAEIGKNTVKLTSGSETMTFQLYVETPPGSSP